jgi:hypothetical protein
MDGHGNEREGRRTATRVRAGGRKGGRVVQLEVQEALPALVEKLSRLLERYDGGAALRRWDVDAPLTAEDVAEVLGVGVSAVHAAVSRGRLVKRGCCRAGFRRSDVLDYAAWRADAAGSSVPGGGAVAGDAAGAPGAPATAGVAAGGTGAAGGVL